MSRASRDRGRRRRGRSTARRASPCASTPRGCWTESIRSRNRRASCACWSSPIRLAANRAYPWTRRFRRAPRGAPARAGAAQELARFEAVGWRYEPDVVVLTFSMSDVGDSTDLSEPRPRAVFQDGLLALEPPLAPPPGRSALGREKLGRIPAPRRVLARLHLLGPRVLQADAGFRDELLPR